VQYDKFTLLIDANAIGYTWQQATRLTTGSMETQAIFGMLKTMRELRLAYPHYTPLILWDGRAEWRYKLYPDYKGNRTSSPEKIAMKKAYATQRPYIERALCHLGVRQLTAYTHEADDMAGHFVRKLSADPTHRVGVITGDQDWLQFVRKNVFWRDMRDDARHVMASNFYQYTGCKTPLQFLERKCLTGDDSDCIKGVGGIGAKGAPEFIAQFGSVREFWRQCDAGVFVPKYKAHQSLWKGEGRENFRRNFQLMQLLKVEPPRREDIKVDAGRFDKDAFGELCEELSFISILKNLDEFTDTFKGKP
jgi:DNA polymerase-1